MLGNGAGGRVCACLCVHAHTHVHGETPTTKTSVAVRGTAEGLGCFLSPSGSKGGDVCRWDTLHHHQGSCDSEESMSPRSKTLALCQEERSWCPCHSSSYKHLAISL